VFDSPGPEAANDLRFRRSPEVVISAGARVKRPGDRMRGQPVELVARHSVGERSPCQLVADAIRGDASLFTRDDGVEAAWRVVEPILRGSRSRPRSTSPPRGVRRPLRRSSQATGAGTTPVAEQRDRGAVERS
jgi:glucose-6-phosphate 1-dehydrogenase